MAPTPKPNLPDRHAIKTDTDVTAKIKATAICSVLPIGRIRSASRKLCTKGNAIAMRSPAVTDLLANRHAIRAPVDSSTPHGATIIEVGLLATADANPATRNATATNHQCNAASLVA